MNRHFTEQGKQMADKDTKRYSTSLSSGKCALKLQSDTPVGMAKILNSDNTKCWWGWREIVLLFHCCEVVRAFRKTVWLFLIKHAMISNCTLVHLSQRNENLCSCNNLNTNIHSSLLCNSRNLKRLRRPSRGEWLNRLWSIHTMESCSAIKEQTTDPQDNQGVSVGDYAEWKKANHRRLHTAWFYSHTFLKWQNDGTGEQTSDYLDKGWREGEGEVGVAVEGWYRDPGGGIFCFLTALTSVSWLWYFSMPPLGEIG